MNHHRRLFQSWLKSRKPVFFICFLKLRKKKGVTNILDIEIFIVSLYDLAGHIKIQQSLETKTGMSNFLRW